MNIPASRTPTSPVTTAPTTPLYGATFGQAVHRFFARYAQFKGLSSPSEYWWAIVFQLTVAVILAVIQVTTESNVFSRMLTIVVELTLLIPRISVTWRRLHDAGFAGSWGFLYVIPGIGRIIVLILCSVPTGRPVPGRWYRAVSNRLSGERPR